jgi:hypothetical protein
LALGDRKISIDSTLTNRINDLRHRKAEMPGMLAVGLSATFPKLTFPQFFPQEKGGPTECRLEPPRMNCKSVAV